MNGVLSIQFEPRINNQKKNFEIIENIISSYSDKKLDLVLFPEFFFTGISHDGFIKFAENENEPVALEFSSNLAKKYKTNVCAGTIIEKEGDKLYNTSYIFNRDGEIVSKYRKIHLFSYLGGCEDEAITAGVMPVLAELDFAKVGQSICFDIRFPLLFNKLLKMGAEVIVCPNAWCLPSNFEEKFVKIKKNEMSSFAVSRASETLTYFIGSSMCGKLGSGLISSANSIIVSPDAEILGQATDGECGIYSEIDLKIVREYKKTFPVYKID